MDDKKLCELAVKAREGAYVPYSGFSVGAALLCADGTVYTGCNIENASFTPTVCAERVAFFRAVNDGHRDFIKIAVAGEGVCPPCGVCRQVMSEFCDGDFEILLAHDGTYERHTLGELLPLAFEVTK